MSVPSRRDVHQERDDRTTLAGGEESFLNTDWSIVLAAGHPACPRAQEAMAELCRKYWYPQ